MPKIGKKVAKWIDSQTKAAEELGVSLSTINRAVSGKARMRLAIFVQIVYFFNPPQDEVDEIFDMYLEDLGIPPGSMRLVKNESADQTTHSSLPIMQSDSRISRIIDAVMASDIDDAAKVKVYNIIKETKKKSGGGNEQGGR